MFSFRTFTCGTCSTKTRGADAVRISAEDMRTMARNGFGDAVPLLDDQPLAQRHDLFRRFADSYTTQWKVCPACAAKAAPYRQGDDAASPTTPTSAAPASAIKDAVLYLPRLARRGFSALVASNAGLVILFALALVVGTALWHDVKKNEKPARWWWQSHSAIAAADARARQKDWTAARDILQRALEEHPANAPLLRRMGNVQMLLGRPDLAGLYYRAFASTPGIPDAARDRADMTADGIDRTLRARARSIFEEVYRLYALLPPAMRQANGPPFYPLEALSIPPLAVSANLAPTYKIESLDGLQAICSGIAYPDRDCAWSFAAVPWHDIFGKRRIAIDYPPRDGRPPCCALSLDDPDLADPAGALRRIAQMPPAHQLRAMFGLASKLAFVANMIAFNDRKRQRGIPR
jgi:hypothetical protein